MTEDTQKIQATQKIIDEMKKIMETQQNQNENIGQQTIAHPLHSNHMVPSSESFQRSTMIIHPQQWTEQTIGTCDLCKKDIMLGKNLSGLVVENIFFACEDCCSKTQHNDILKWAKSKMIKNNTVRPIGLWLTQEKNKEKTVLFKQ